MENAESEIEEIIDRETRAWDTKDVDLLLSIFHTDMVWVWPAAEAAPVSSSYQTSGARP